MKDPERQRDKKSYSTYMKILKDRFLKDNQIEQMTLKEYIDHFQQDLNEPESTPIAIEDTKCMMREKHKNEINISIGVI